VSVQLIEEGEMKRIGLLPLALVAGLAIACADQGQVGESAVPGTEPAAVGTGGAERSDVSNDDRDFVRDLSIANMAEVELGKMAVANGANAEIKKFGQMMVDDHTKAGASLKSLATEHNIPVATELDVEHQSLRDKLAKLKGAAFDREYASAMVDGHEKVLEALEARIDTTNLADWKANATNRAAGKKVDVSGSVGAIQPEESDNAATMSINRWAADAYPVVYAHLENAKATETALQKGPRTTD
jgi:putative membrane protein